jgi:catalase
MDGEAVVRRDDNPPAMSTDEFMAQYEVEDNGVYMTNPVGGPIEDQNSLKAGERGPTLLEDQIFRRKVSCTSNNPVHYTHTNLTPLQIMHFDHERVPERAVHARGAGAHGTFVSYGDWSNITGASFLNAPGKETPTFLRFSTVAGSRGSADTVRDVHGFAVRFYTDEGNFGEY